MKHNIVEPSLQQILFNKQFKEIPSIDKKTRSYRLQNIFNSNTVKVSNSCISNMSKINKGNNKKVPSKPLDQTPKCNWRKIAEYPIEGSCQVNGVIYKCDVTRPLSKKCIFDLLRKNARTASITTSSHSNTRDTPIGQHFQITVALEKGLKWPVLRCMPPYSNISKKNVYEK